jgi:DNA-binding transcriptional regulator YdaS (Cro superfamily)
LERRDYLTEATLRIIEEIGDGSVEEGVRRLRSETSRAINWVAIAVNKAGGAKVVAARLGVSIQSVYKWMDHGVRQLTYERVEQIAELTGFPVSVLTIWRGDDASGQRNH